MRYLGISEYDTTETEAICNLPNRVIEAFQPVHFNSVGYPARVRRESELIKYVDTMQELTFDPFFATLLHNGITQDEFVLIRRVTDSIVAFTAERLHDKVLAKGALIRSLNVLRHIKYIYGDSRPRILEIGPGSGYLGAMLHLEGYPYAATDVTQAFYLFQNHFWTWLSQQSLVELAATPVTNQLLESSHFLHIPWWVFATNMAQLCPSFDLITCNSALCEMHPNALGYTINLAHALLQKDQRTPKTLIFDGWGATRLNPIGAVAEGLSKGQFVFCHCDGCINVLTLSRTDCSTGHLRLPRRSLRGFAPIANAVRRLIGLPAINAWTYEPRTHVSLENKLSKLIICSRMTGNARRSVHKDEVKQYFQRAVGSDRYLTADEAFLCQAQKRVA